MTAPAGFARNGSRNPALKAMLARVGAGTGRGRIVFKGDSTTVGQGAGTGLNALAGARPARVPAALAAELTGMGLPTFDNGLFGPAGCYDAGVEPELYDPRLTRAAPPWALNGGAALRGFAGGGFLSDNLGTLGFTLSGVDRFELVLYNSNNVAIDVSIDGSPPAALALDSSTGPAPASVSGQTVTVRPGGGFSRIVARAPAVGDHRVELATRAGTPATQGALRSLYGYQGGAAGIDLLCHAACGAQSAEQAAARPDGWGNNDALAFDAPDLTIVNLGLNDAAHGVTPGDYARNLQAIVTQAQASGDVSLVAPHPAAESFAPLAAQAALRDAAATVAAAAGVAFFSLFDQLGGSFSSALAARMSDGVVHGDAGLYAEEGRLYLQSIQAMAS